MPARRLPSKVNNFTARVPTTALTVTHSPALADAPVPGLHATVVLDVHADVLHSSSMIACAVGVLAAAPKLSPEIVTDMRADDGEFVLGSKLATGAATILQGHADQAILSPNPISPKGLQYTSVM